MAVSDKAINFLQGSLERGRPIPGQSLTNSPEQPYNWEKAPELVNPKEAMLDVFNTLIQEDSLLNILNALDNGVGVIDLASVTLYTGFLEGKWNPDLMMLLMEPTIYMIMALAEKAEIDYVLEAGDDVVKSEMSSDDQLKEINSGVKSLQQLQRKAAGKVNEASVPAEVRQVIEEAEIPESLLNKREPKQNNLLDKEA
jgi:hypothetical protein